MRKVIIHYHIFKNAGTSIDHMLRESLGDRWIAWDLPASGGRISPAELETFIDRNPEAVAFSSHQIIPPLPSGKFKVFPIVFIRHPLDRAYSAFLFEWAKQKGMESPVGHFEEFVDERFRLKRRSAIEDFQTLHLANRGYHSKMPSSSLGDEDILRNAKEFLLSLPFCGIVERFDESLDLMRMKYARHFPDLSFKKLRANSLQNPELPLAVKMTRMAKSIQTDCYNKLVLRNQLDLRLYEFADALFLGKVQKIRKDLRNAENHDAG